MKDAERAGLRGPPSPAVPAADGAAPADAGRRAVRRCGAGDDHPAGGPPVLAGCAPAALVAAAPGRAAGGRPAHRGARGGAVPEAGGRRARPGHPRPAGLDRGDVRRAEPAQRGDLRRRRLPVHLDLAEVPGRAAHQGVRPRARPPQPRARPQPARGHDVAAHLGHRRRRVVHDRPVRQRDRRGAAAGDLRRRAVLAAVAAGAGLDDRRTAAVVGRHPLLPPGQGRLPRAPAPGRVAQRGHRGAAVERGPRPDLQPRGGRRRGLPPPEPRDRLRRAGRVPGSGRCSCRWPTWPSWSAPWP